MKKDAYLYFIDYAKTLDNVCQKDLLQLLGNYEIYRKDIRINQALVFNKYAKIERSVFDFSFLIQNIQCGGSKRFRYPTRIES